MDRVHYGIQFLASKLDLWLVTDFMSYSNIIKKIMATTHWFFKYQPLINT